MILSLAGGIDEVSAALAVNKGRVVSAVNHEVADNGYARSGGYERFDGQTSPTDAVFWMLGVSLTDAIADGSTITGDDSGATGILLVAADEDATVVGICGMAGQFIVGEDLLVAAAVVGTVTLIAREGSAESPDTLERAAALARRTYARGLIAKPPGSGSVRGVLEYRGDIYAWRDNEGATAGRCWLATDAGWVEAGTGSYRLAFDSGTQAVPEGATITGLTTGAVARVERVVVQSGDVDANDAAGYFVVTVPLGTFITETVAVAGVPSARVLGAAATHSFPPGGRYYFEIHNFYGGVATDRAYGVNGVGDAFEFDGSVVATIENGSVAFPSRVAVYKEHLFLGRAGGIDGSSTGLPLLFDASLGAVAIEVGSNVTDLLTITGALAIFAEQSVSILTGSSSQDFQKETLTDSAGALPNTAQVAATGVYIDNRGLRSLTATQAYGKFTMGTMSNDVRKTMAEKKRGGLLPAASMMVGTKNQYRLIYSDGSGVTWYMGRKTPEPMLFEMGIIPTCSSVTATEASEERLFVGAEDGFVYQLDKGDSFDGATIAAYIQFPYHHDGSPTLLKRWVKARIELECGPEMLLGMVALYDYSNDEQPMTATSDVLARGGGGLWGIANYGDFYWGAPVYGAVESDDLDGSGANMSLILHTNSAETAGYVLQAAMIDYLVRGQKR